MFLYLVRHAQAANADEDAMRPLSERGCEEIGRLAKFLQTNRPIQAEEIWHSPLARARQTARLLATGLGMRAPLSGVTGLEPDRNPGLIAARLQSCDHSVMIVGHEPNLSVLASLLVAEAPKPIFAFRTSSLLALE